MNRPVARHSTPARNAEGVARRMQDAVLREQIGRNLMIAREALGATRSEWLKKYGLYASKYSQWEAGTVLPNLLFLIAICDDYGLTMDWFLRGVRAGVSSSVAEALKGVAVERSAVPSEAAPQLLDTE
jgi:transcriptional regulator with XRE-family HTH domain